jgi:hypothetical protein
MINYTALWQKNIFIVISNSDFEVHKNDLVQ